MNLLSSLDIWSLKDKDHFLLILYIFYPQCFGQNLTGVGPPINFGRTKGEISDGQCVKDKGKEWPAQDDFLGPRSFGPAFLYELLQARTWEVTVTQASPLYKNAPTRLQLVQRVTNKMLKGIRGDRLENFNSSWKDTSWACLKFKIHWRLGWGKMYLTVTVK